MHEHIDNIKVFISSTFRDLNQERDYLVQKVFPEIRDNLNGITVCEVDLRWGITDEESREKRVVDLCLQYLYQSKPFFVGILGERYGSIISPEDVMLSPLVEEVYPQVTKDLQNRLSITEIEIMNGVFRAPKDKQPIAIFFIKETAGPSSGEDMEKFRKLQELKRKVLAQKDFPVYKYSDLKDLDKLKEFILEKLGVDKEMRHTPPKSPILSMIQAYSQRFKTFYNMNDWNSDNQQIISQLHMVIERARPVAVLEGIEGLGKSALVTRLATANGGRRFIYVYGDTPQLPSTNSLMVGFFLNEVRRQLQEEYESQASKKGWSGWVTRNFKKIDLNIDQNLVEELAKRKWCFVLDETCALRLKTISSTRYLLHPIANAVLFLEKEFKVKIDYRVLLVQNSGSPYSATPDAYERFVMPMRQPEDGWRYIDNYLKRYSKNLGTEQIKQLKACMLMRHPRSVNLVIKYMRLYVCHEQLPTFIKTLATFTTTGDTYHLYLDKLDTILTRQQQRRLAGIISLFSCGPMIRHLKELASLPDIDFHRAWACLSSLTSESNTGGIRWANDSIGRFIDNFYGLSETCFRQQLAKECSNYFFDQIKDLHTPEKLHEYLHKNWWMCKGDVLSAISRKYGMSLMELRSMDDMQLLGLITRLGVLNIDFVREYIYPQVRSSRIFNQVQRTMKKTKDALKEQSSGKRTDFKEVMAESANHMDNGFWQWMAHYRQPTVVELTCYLEALCEAGLWKQLGNELANPEVLNYVWQTSVVIDCWNVAMNKGGISIIQPDMKTYDKMLLVSYALRNAEGIAYYSQHQMKK